MVLDPEPHCGSLIRGDDDEQLMDRHAAGVHQKSTICGESWEDVPTRR